MEQKPIRITFGTLEAVLANLHEIADTKRTAFQSRLKNFHRLGYPLRFESSKGKAGIYAPGTMVEIALALEMTQLGLSPERIVNVLTLNRFPVFSAIRMATGDLCRKPNGFDVESVKADDPSSMFLFFDPAALSGLMKNDPEQPNFDVSDYSFFYGGAGVVRENLVKWTSGFLNRLSLINVTAMIDSLAYMACPADVADTDATLAFKQAFFAELLEWADRNYDETYEHDAEWFIERLLVQGRVVPGDDDLETIVDKMVGESGLKRETIRKGLQKFASEHFDPLAEVGDGSDS